MSLSVDARYRTLTVSWVNHDALGAETVQVFAKPLGGAWSLVRSAPVMGVSQSTSWTTALPVQSYDVAIRYVNGGVSGVGYAGTDPDTWTAATAPGARTTMNTRSEVVTWVGGTFVNAATPIPLQWTSAQLGVPYLLEKNPGTGWVTVAAGLVDTTYLYTIPGAELSTTVQFRVTAQRGAIAGPSVTASVAMIVTVGVSVLAVPSFNTATRVASFSWSAATNATGYRLEQSTNGGSSWSTVVLQAGLTYGYNVPDAEINTTVQFRVFGTNGAISGAASNVQSVAMTVAVGSSVLAVPSWDAPIGRISLSWSAASNAYAYKIFKNVNGAGWVGVFSATGTTSYEIQLGEANQSIAFRVTPYNGPVNGADSNERTVIATVVLNGPTGLSVAGGTATWTPASGDVWYLNVETSVNGVSDWSSIGGPNSPFDSTYSYPWYLRAGVYVRVRAQAGGNGGLTASSNVALAT